MSVTRAARTRYSTPDGCNLAGPATIRPRPGLDHRVVPEPALPSSAASDGRSRRADGCGRPVLQSVRRCRYDTASLRRPPARRPDAGHRATTRHAPRRARHRCDPPRVSRAAGSGRRGSGLAPRRGVASQAVSTGDMEEYWMKLHKVSALAAVSILAFAACSTSGGQRARQRAAAVPRAGGDTSKGTVKIAIELPLQGSELAASQPIDQRHPTGREASGRRCRRLQGRDPRLGALR